MTSKHVATLLAALLLAAAAPAAAPNPAATPNPAAPKPAAPAPTPAPTGTPVTLTSQPNTQLDRAARALSRDDLAEAGKSGEIPLLLVGAAKLSPTGRPALFVQLQSPRECGSAGCNTSVYLWRANTWTRILDGVGGRLSVSPTRTRGMSDLLTEKARYVWDGKAYHDARPAPAVDLRPKR